MNTSIFTGLNRRLFLSLYETFCENASTTYILVDCNIKSVSVPFSVIKENHVTLNLSARTIRNFAAGFDGISFRARFGGRDTDLFIPYQAIISMYNPYTHGGLRTTGMFANEPLVETTDETQKPGLTSVTTTTTEPTESQPKPSVASRASFLRVVK